MSEPVMQRLKISREGIILIKSFEGFRPRAVRREDGQWVIGYGHTLSAREGASVSEADAELLLQYDLIPVAHAVNEGVAQVAAQVADGAVNQHQLDALASFAFSIGVDRFRSSDVLSRLVAGSAGEAADAIVNWPEPALPEASLRRRAAERALFVADPAWPVALSDLLSAPLPPPAAPVQTVDVETVAVPQPESVHTDGSPTTEAQANLTTADVAPPPSETPVPVAAENIPATDPKAPDLDASRQAAVATLLGEMTEPASPVELGGTEPSQPEPVQPADEDVEPETMAPEPVTELSPAAVDGAETAAQDTTVFASELETTLEIVSAPTAETTAAGVIETPVAAVPLTFDPLPAEAPASFNASSRFSPYAGPIVGALEAGDQEPVLETRPALARADDPGPAGEPAPFPSPEPITPVLAEASATSTSELAPETPATIVTVASDDGTGFPPLAIQEPAPVEAGSDPEPQIGTEPEPAPIAPSWPTLTAESEPRADGELLVLTALPEDGVFPAPRLVWPHGEGDETQTPPLFEDDGSLRLGGSPLLRPEPLEAFTPKRVAWGEMGAFLVMGGFGLVSFGMAMAAFRRASQSASGSNELTIIAIVLAVFGAACVGVSAYNLYRRWGREDEV